MSADRKSVQAFLQDVAESEHHIRHPGAFAALVKDAGFTLKKLEHRFEVHDAQAPSGSAVKREPAKAP
jgi:hypothetical protein